MDTERDICCSSNVIRKIRWTIAGLYKMQQNTWFVALKPFGTVLCE